MKATLWRSGFWLLGEGWGTDRGWGGNDQPNFPCNTIGHRLSWSCCPKRYLQICNRHLNVVVIVVVFVVVGGGIVVAIIVVVVVTIVVLVIAAILISLHIPTYKNKNKPKTLKLPLPPPLPPCPHNHHHPTITTTTKARGISANICKSCHSDEAQLRKHWFLVTFLVHIGSWGVTPSWLIFLYYFTTSHMDRWLSTTSKLSILAGKWHIYSIYSMKLRILHVQ